MPQGRRKGTIRFSVDLLCTQSHLRNDTYLVSFSLNACNLGVRFSRGVSVSACECLGRVEGRE